MLLFVNKKKQNIGKMLAANEGLGFLISSSRVSLSTEMVYVANLLLGVLGLVPNSSFRRLVVRFGLRYRI
jgi:ABC-type nitrate/sulfonate/bicarbonate transport system permease component